METLIRKLLEIHYALFNLAGYPRINALGQQIDICHRLVSCSSHILQTLLASLELIKSDQLHKVHSGVGEVVRLVVDFPQEWTHVVRRVAPELGQIPNEEVRGLDQIFSVEWGYLFQDVLHIQLTSQNIFDNPVGLNDCNFDTD